jgi:hypothetical protein
MQLALITGWDKVSPQARQSLGHGKRCVEIEVTFRIEVEHITFRVSM